MILNARSRIILLQITLFSAMGSCVPFISLYFKKILVYADGSPADYWIGIIFFIQAAAGIFTPMLAGMITDKFKIENRVLALCAAMVFLSGVILLVPALAGIKLNFGTQLMLCLSGMTLNGLFVRPIVPLIDTEILNFLSQSEGNTSRYGNYRVTGTLTWIIITCGAGVLLYKTQNLFFVFFCYSVGFLLVSITATSGFSHNIKPNPIPWHLLKHDKTLRRFLTYAFIMSLGLSSSFNFTSYFLDDNQADFFIIGLVFGLAAIPEIPIMLSAHRILQKIQPRTMVMIGTFIHSLKLTFFFLAAPLGLGWLYIVINLLSGFGYGFLFNGIVQFLDQLAHRDLRATYQNLYHLVSTIGMAFGMLGGSVIIARINSSHLMLIYALVLFLAVAYLYLFVKKPQPGLTASANKGINTHTDGSA